MKNQVRSGEKPHVVFVAGMGCRMTSSPLLTMMSERCTALGLPQHAVEGTFINQQGDMEVTPPSRQNEEIATIMNGVEADQPILLVSHCIGAIATLDTLEKHQDGPVKGLLVAPPFIRPLETVSSPQVQKKITHHGGTSYMATYDFSPDAPFDFDQMTMTPAKIGRRFYPEVAAVSEGDDFLGRASDLAYNDELGLVVPGRDWNTAGIEATREWAGPVLALEGGGHSLNVVSRSLEMQRQLCDESLAFGLEL